MKTSKEISREIARYMVMGFEVPEHLHDDMMESIFNEAKQEAEVSKAKDSSQG